MSNKLLATFLVAVLVLSSGSVLAPAAGANDHVADGERNVADGERIVSMENLQQQEPRLILAFADDYRVGVSFEVMNRLPQGTVNDVLDGDDGTVVNNPTEYTGYVVELYPDDDTSEYTFVFVRDGRLSSDTRYQFDDDVTVFSIGLNLLEVGIQSEDASSDSDESTQEETTETPEGDESTPDDETATTEEETETPEEAGGETEGDEVVDETAEDAPAEEQTTTVEADESGILSGIVDFLGRLLGGDGDDGSQTPTVEGGLVR